MACVSHWRTCGVVLRGLMNWCRHTQVMMTIHYFAVCRARPGRRLGWIIISWGIRERETPSCPRQTCTKVSGRVKTRNHQPTMRAIILASTVMMYQNLSKSLIIREETLSVLSAVQIFVHLNFSKVEKMCWVWIRENTSLELRILMIPLG